MTNTHMHAVKLQSRFCLPGCNRSAVRLLETLSFIETDGLYGLKAQANDAAALALQSVRQKPLVKFKKMKGDEAGVTVAGD